MKLKVKYLVRRALAFAMVMAMLWSDTSFVSLAQTLTPENETVQTVEEPSSEPSKEPEESPAENLDNTVLPADTPSAEPTEETKEPDGESEEETSTPSLVPSITPSETPAIEPGVTVTPSETPAMETEATATPTATPSMTPSETPTMTPSATPADMELVRSGEDRFTLRINRIDTEDYDPESGIQIAADAMIYLYDNDNQSMLNTADIQEVKWYKAVGDGDFSDDSCWDDACFPLDHKFFLFESRLKVVIKVSESEQYELYVNNIQPGECAPGQGVLQGVLLPDNSIIINGAEGDIFKGNSVFFRADDINGSNAQQISNGDAINYILTEEDNGKYIFAKYGIWNQEELKIDYYQTQAVGPVGYIVGGTEADWEKNALLLQSQIDSCIEISEQINMPMKLTVPQGVKIKADQNITLNKWIRMEAYEVDLYGGIVIEETSASIQGNASVSGLHIIKEGGIAVDASQAPVTLYNCNISGTGAVMLQVSGDTYSNTCISDCDASFTAGGCLLKIAAGGQPMPSEFQLGNTDLRVQISDNNSVAMLELEESAADGDTKWNVEGLQPQNIETIARLSVPENGLINNAFYIDGVNGMVAGSGVLTMDSVSKKWISPYLADGTSFAGSDTYKIIVRTPEEYEVLSIPADIDWAFRPYAVTGQYGAGAGDYAKLLPAGCVTYVVIDVNQKDSFPYGALISRKLENCGDNYVLMQYHADKSLETVAQVTDGAASVKEGSILEELTKSGDSWQIKVNTKVKGEPVDEPIVLAVYSELPSSVAGLKVLEEEETEEGTVKVSSDGQILTDGTKKVYFELNGGIAQNYYSGNAFELNTDKCTIPKGSAVQFSEMTGSMAVLEIPENTYGTLTVTAHYKSSAGAAEVKLPFTLQLTSVQNAEGISVDYVNAGNKYYGTATFDVLSSVAKPFIGVSAGKGENDEGGYNFKVTSASLTGSKVTVQYMLDLRGNEAWREVREHTPELLVETVAGIYTIPLETTGAQATVVDEEKGLMYLFDLEGGNAVYTGALIIDGGQFYNGETKIVIPGTVEADGQSYSVTAMAEGCLNNIYENGIKAYAPDIVEIPASVQDIRGMLITNPDYSNLRQIIVADGNSAYKSYGPAADAAGEERDDAQYCALYKVNGSSTELIEIASNYTGELAWRSDAVWTEDTYLLDFSGINSFRCDDDGNYRSYDGILVEEKNDGVTAIKVPEYGRGNSLILPEGIQKLNAGALENLAVTTLVLPSSMTEWENGAVTQAKNIYVYNQDTTVNPCVGLDSSLKGITFYGFVDKSQNSALKAWVAASKSQSYKFVAMKESDDPSADYTVKTLRNAVTTYLGTEYYEVFVGEELTENFDFDLTSKVVNGYQGKTDLTVEWAQDDQDFGLKAGEFEEQFRGDGTKIYKAVNPGVAKVVIKKDESIIKTAYFVVRPNYFEITEGNKDMSLGQTQQITVKSFIWNENAQQDEEVVLSSETLQEYDRIGAIQVLISDERAVGKNGEYDAWQTELSTEQGLAYNVTPLLYQDSNGEVKGGCSTEFALSLFGDKHSVWIQLQGAGEEEKELNVSDFNPLIQKGETIDIPIYLWNEEENQGTPLAYALTLGKTLKINQDGSSSYVEEESTYQQAVCEVVSGNKSVDAQIVEKDGKAYLQVTGKADGKAEIAVAMPYNSKEMRITVSVGKDLVQRFALKLTVDGWEPEVLDSTINPEDDPYYCPFDINDEVWKNVITVSDINDTTGEEPYKELSSSKLNWTVSDASLAELVKGDGTDKNKVTGIRLKGEGTVLVTATVKDTNAASIRMLFTVRDYKPRLSNDSAVLDIYDAHSAAKYEFAVPEGMEITGAALAKAQLSGTSVLDAFDIDREAHRMKVVVKDVSKLSKGNCDLTLKITVADRRDEQSSSYEYEYPVKLQLTDAQPKVTVTAQKALDLGVLTGRETDLTVKVGNYTDSESNVLSFDTADATTGSFSQYFVLEKKENIYSIRLSAANGKTPAEIAKLFNGKKIKLNIVSDDYRKYPNKAEISFKITATTPVLKPANGGKVTVNTSDVSAYAGNVYYSKMSYTLTDGFAMSSGQYGVMGTEDTLGTIRIADKQADYARKFNFVQGGGKLSVLVDPGVPKGTYQFTWAPKVCAGDEDTIFGWQNLKEQKINVVVSGSSAKIAISTTKLTLDKNYIYSTADANLQFDESQIKTIYGGSYWMVDYDTEKTLKSLTLVKAPKGVTEDNSNVLLTMDYNTITAAVKNEGAVAGEYKYSLTPYIHVGAWIDDEEKDIIMALAPVTFSVQVTDSLPTATLDKTSVALDNNDMSLRTLISWNVKGNYQWIEGGTVEAAQQTGAPLVYLEGDTVRVQAGEDTLKGTYKFTITPSVVLDTITTEEEGETKNQRELKPVVLTVKVNSTRPTLKLEKSSLTAYSYYPGFDDGENFYTPAEAGTGVETSNGYGIKDIQVVAADKNSEAIQNDPAQAISFSMGIDSEGYIQVFNAIPTTKTPKGAYNYLVYAKIDGDENGVALEPVKLKVTVSSNKPDLKLSTNNVQILAGWSGNMTITLSDKAGCVDHVTEKTEYLIQKDGKWQICAESEASADDAYAVLVTSGDGSIYVETGNKAASLTKAVKVAVPYAQEVFLKGNADSYMAAYSLNINFAVTKPAAVVSTKTITLNKNYYLNDQADNYLSLSLNNGADIDSYEIEDQNTGNKKDAIELGETENFGNELIFAVFAKKSTGSLESGKYSFRITPRALNAAGKSEELAPVTIAVQLTEKAPTVKADKTKVTINRLDSRGNTWQDISFSSDMPYVDLRYKVEITKGPKGADLSEIEFFPRGRIVDGDGVLTIGTTDMEIPDGTYQVTVTPYTFFTNGKIVYLKGITVSVTVNAPKIKAALQTPKMNIDVADPNRTEMQNAIVLSGTNAELVQKFYWKDWELTKKPKGAGDNEIWIEDLVADDDHDGKSFSVCWGNREHDYSQGPRWSDITPGTYEFTLIPGGIESADGVSINTPEPLKLTVNVKNSVPTIKYSKSSSKLNAVFGTEDPIYYTLSDSSWNIANVDAVMTAWPKNAGEEKAYLRIGYEGNGLVVRSSDNVPEGTYTFMLGAEVQKGGIQVPLKEQKFTVTVKNDIPAVKTSSSKLTLNALYGGCYGFEEDPAENFNKKRQMQLTLAQNYGACHFEPDAFGIKFTGKDAQKTEADKIEWRIYDDGTIAADLSWGSVAAAGSYPFEITPVLRSDVTGTKITLKPIKLTVAVENKALKATAKASGKIDLLDREGSGITYQVTLSDKDVDAVKEINLRGPEKGEDYSWKFEIFQDQENNPGECIIRAKDWSEGGDELSTKVNYEMRLEVRTEYNKVYYIPVKIKPMQSRINLTTDVKAITLFKQAAEDTAAVVQIKAAVNNTEEGQLEILSGENDITTGNTDFKAVVVSGSRKEGCKIKLVFASETAKSKYKAGSKVTVPVYVQVYNQAIDTYSTTKVNITATIKN